MSTTQYTQAELTAKKVPELKVGRLYCPTQPMQITDCSAPGARVQTILGTLKLSQIGVKADLVTRILEEQQKQGGSEGKTDLGAASNALGDIPSEDKLPSVAGGADAPAASAVTDAPQSTSVEGDASAEVAGATETGATAEGGDAPDTSAADAFGADLPTPEGTTKESEAQKRAKRLERFGGNEAELEKLQRAERFGTSVVDDSVRRAICERRLVCTSTKGERGSCLCFDRLLRNSTRNSQTSGSARTMEPLRSLPKPSRKRLLREPAQTATQGMAGSPLHRRKHQSLPSRLKRSRSVKVAWRASTRLAERSNTGSM